MPDPSFEDSSSRRLLWDTGQFWDSLSPRARAGTIFRAIFDRGIELSRRRRMRRITLRELTEPRGLSQSDVPLLLVVRNELSRLPQFLEHYRGLGVSRFLVVDDQSSDGTVDYLTAQQDANVFASNVRYGDAQKGELWRQALAERFGLNRWYLNVDADEFLIYDAMDRHPLPLLIQRLEASGRKRALAPMVDLYPSQELSAAEYDPGKHPWEVAALFDSTGYRARARPMHLKISGGPMERYFRKAGSRTKFPLLYWDRYTFLARSIHAPLPYWRNFDPPVMALLHFRLFSDFKQKCVEAIEDGQRHSSARAHKLYYERLNEPVPILLCYDHSVRFVAPETLIEHGFMLPLDWH